MIDVHTLYFESNSRNLATVVGNIVGYQIPLHKCGNEVYMEIAPINKLLRDDRMYRGKDTFQNCLAKLRCLPEYRREVRESVPLGI